MAGAVVELPPTAGAHVAAGDDADGGQRHEDGDRVTAPCAGVVDASLAPVEVGGAVAAGQIVATIAPAQRTATRAAPRSYGEDTWAPMLAEVQALQAIAHARFAPGSNDPGVVRQRNRGKLTCRERIDLLLDRRQLPRGRQPRRLRRLRRRRPGIADFTPANHVGGWGKIDGRTAVVCADDFTSRGGHADGAIGAKSGHLDRLSLELRCPSIRLLDGSSGGGSVAAMVPKQQKPPARAARQGKLRRDHRRPARACPAAAARSCPATWAARMFAEQLATVPVVNCCSAAWSASARPRPCSATSRSWCATSPSCSWPARRW